MSMPRKRHSDQRETSGGPNDPAGKTIENEKGDLQALLMEIVLNHRLETKRGVVGAGDDEQEHEHRIHRFGEIGRNRALLGADIGERRSDKPDRKRHERQRRDTQSPKMMGSGSRGTETLDFSQR